MNSPETGVLEMALGKQSPSPPNVGLNPPAHKPASTQVGGPRVVPWGIAAAARGPRVPNCGIHPGGVHGEEVVSSLPYSSVYISVCLRCGSCCCMHVQTRHVFLSVYTRGGYCTQKHVCVCVCYYVCLCELQHVCHRHVYVCRSQIFHNI